ncbi:MAG: BRO family protein [Ktedonobacteraceae bacterium]
MTQPFRKGGSMDSPDFESIKRVNMLGDEYWSARDLAPLLGYSSSTAWQHFERAINSAVIAATEGGLNLAENFSAVTKVSGKRGPAQKDYFLSKRACFLVAQNADPRKPEVAAAQNFFAWAGEIVDDMTRLRLAQEKRLKLRRKVAEGNKQLAQTALKSGVKPENMPIFEDAGYLGQYNMTENQLSIFWNVPEGTAILDVMSSASLAANLFRITQTDEKLIEDQVTTEGRAIATHHDVGVIVRQAVEEIHKKKPEDLPREASIRKLVEAERRKARKQKKLQSPPDEQERLF